MKKSAFLLFSVLFLFSCSTTTQFVNPAPEMAGEDWAEIYIIRPSNFASLIKMKVYQDDQLIGKLGPKSYLSWKVPPSEEPIHIISKTENKATLALLPKAGEKYYIRQRTGMGMAMARSKIEFMEEAEALSFLKELEEPQVEFSR